MPGGGGAELTPLPPFSQQQGLPWTHGDGAAAGGAAPEATTHAEQPEAVQHEARQALTPLKPSGTMCLPITTLP